MISIKGIDWQPIAILPEDRRDGRFILLWNESANIGQWEAGPRWWNDEPGWIDDGEGGPIDDVRFWADINPPE